MANTAQATADRKNKVFRQDSPPTAENVGDLWFDSNDDDKARRWNGSNWVPMNLYTGNQVAATIEDYNATRVGYCMVNGSPDSTVDSKALCEATSGGVWLDMYAIADAVKGVQIDDGEGGSGSVQQKMTSYRDDLGDIQSMYTLKVQIDPNDSTQGIIKGGLGIGADESTGLVDAGFDVDTFWVGRLGQKTFPFTIDSYTGETFIDEAVIESLTFNKLRADDGSVIIENGKLKAEFIEADNIVTRQMQSSSNVTVGGSTGPAFDFNTDGSFSLRGKDSTGGVIQDTEGTRVYDSNGTLRVKLGKL